ncbi:hypothetical protein L204_100651 [Cryptococcus depauperatus]|nr:hypothetical protein L204_01418 [Cryptococcus depauperatus CBS 7855]
MPRAVLPLAETQASVDAPSPIVQALRRDWRWAAVSQFILTFSDAFGLWDWDIQALERDFDGDETELIPTLIVKLLFALTYNRQINRENAFENLRKQYLKRQPDSNPVGTLEEPIEWWTLGLSVKVGVLHQLCEWQMEDPARFRGLLKSEDDAGSWRIDPVGWDKVGNTYWLFDDNRLWVQRPPPTPPRLQKKNSIKAKRALKRARPDATAGAKSKGKSTPKTKPPPKPKPKAALRIKDEKEKVMSMTPPAAEVEDVSGSRKRSQVSFYGNPTPTHLALRRGGPQSIPPQSAKRSTRSSARFESANTFSQTTPEKSTPSKIASGKTHQTSRPLGTRVSRRLTDIKDDWQKVPAEWMSKNSPAEVKSEIKNRDGAESDDESELSELTDEEEHQSQILAIVTSASKSKPTPALKNKANGKTQMKEEVDYDSPLSDLPVTEPDAIPASEENEGGEYQPDSDTSDTEIDDEKMDLDGREEEAEENRKEEEEDIVKVAVQEANSFPEDFIEWEAVCVTLHDWQTFPEQFAKSKHPDEKALYKLLTQTVGPTIIEQLAEIERERLKNLAFQNRKRSSRIATKELEREELLRREAAQREMEERMERTRREEEKKKQEEQEHIARERAREYRLREREERAQAREEAILRKTGDELKPEELLEQMGERRRKRREGFASDDSDKEGTVVGKSYGEATEISTLGEKTVSGSHEMNVGAVVAGDKWEVACEMCGTRGWNLDGDRDLVSCDECGRWQHVACLDKFDESQGKAKRNWDKTDFKCKDCLLRTSRKRTKINTNLHLNGFPQSQYPSPLGPRSAYSGPPSPYPVMPGSAPGPVPPLDPSHPPPPPLQPGQYYLPYPPPSEPQSPIQPKPAGYAVYYSPGQSREGERRVSVEAIGRKVSAEESLQRRVSDSYPSVSSVPSPGYSRSNHSGQGHYGHVQSQLAQSSRSSYLPDYPQHTSTPRSPHRGPSSFPAQPQHRPPPPHVVRPPQYVTAHSSPHTSHTLHPQSNYPMSQHSPSHVNPYPTGQPYSPQYYYSSQAHPQTKMDSYGHENGNEHAGKDK